MAEDFAVIGDFEIVALEPGVFFLLEVEKSLGIFMPGSDL